MALLIRGQVAQQQTRQDSRIESTLAFKVE